MTAIEGRPDTETEATRQLGTATDHCTTGVLGYGSAAQLYRDAGWQGVLPLRPRQKVPHLAGFTGYDGAWPTDEQIAAWGKDQPADANLMLRVNYGVIGVDVDAHRTAAEQASQRRRPRGSARSRRSSTRSSTVCTRSIVGATTRKPCWS